MLRVFRVRLLGSALRFLGKVWSCMVKSIKNFVRKELLEIVSYRKIPEA